MTGCVLVSEYPDTNSQCFQQLRRLLLL